MKNKNIGAKVIVKRVLVSITQENGWQYIKNVPGVLVEKEGRKQYYHTSNGNYTWYNKHFIENDPYENYAIKLDNGIVDIEGNNIIVERDWEIKFLETLPKKEKKLKEAVEFGEWLRTFPSLSLENGFWCLECQLSTEELYNLFLGEKKKGIKK